MIEAFAQGIGFAIGFFLTAILAIMFFAGIAKQGDRGDGVDTRGQGKD